jgi:hypothetical protein
MKQKLWFDGGVKNGRLAVGLEDDLAKEPAATVTAHIRGKGAKAYARCCFLSTSSVKVRDHVVVD